MVLTAPKLEGHPFYAEVPKRLLENLQFRKLLYEAAEKERSLQEELWIACKRDLLFWVNTFVWTYDPRAIDADRDPVAPFITYEFQDDVLREIRDAIGRHDLFADKSRDQGASWMILMVFTWLWMFRPNLSFLLASRKEDLVDKTEDPDCLFWKIDFILKRLPPWMLPRYGRTKLHLKNNLNGSVIDGESATGDLGRGGRRTAIMCDEFAAFETEDGYRAIGSTQHATPCRIFNSTPQGVGNAFADLREKASHKLSMRWTDHPVQSRGIYQERAGKLWIGDADYWVNWLAERDFGYGPLELGVAIRQGHLDYPFIRDGKKRSPYYDLEEARNPVASIIAQELDIDYLGAGRNFFDGNKLDQMIVDHSRDPDVTYTFDYGDDGMTPVGLIASEQGILKLWRHYSMAHRPPRDRHYGIGSDVSFGTGASNSASSIVDFKTGEKIGELVTSVIPPHKYAILVTWLGRFFTGEDGISARLIWEANGPGALFADAVMEDGYGNIFFRGSVEDKVDIKDKISTKPGWWSSKPSKLRLLEQYAQRLGAGLFINRSKQAYNECRQYCFANDGTVIHSKERNAPDPTGARDAHGDIVIADALACRIMKEVQGAPQKEERPANAKYMTPMWRRNRRQAKKAQSENWLYDRCD